jgi:tetratricopeptide (TPR) repeat protein
MAVDPTDRYASPRALADDVEAWLADEPVKAWRDPVMVRLRRWARHHQTLVTSVAAAVLVATICLVVGLSLLAAAKRRETAAKELALANAQRAEANFRKAREVADEFFTEVSESHELLRGTPGTQELRKRLLERAGRYYEEFIEDHPADDTLQADLGGAHFRLAKISAETGERLRAAGLYRTAIEIQDRIARKDPSNAQYQEDLSGSYNNLGNALDDLGKLEEAATTYEKAIEIQQRLVREYPSHPAYQYDLATVHNNLGHLYQKTGRPDEALAEFRKAIEIRKRLVREHPSERRYQSGLARSFASIGWLYRETSRPDEAAAAHQKSTEIRERLVSENPAVPEYQADLSDSYNTLGILHRQSGRLEEAFIAYQEAITVQERLAAENPTVTLYRHDLAISHNNLGNLYRQTGRRDEALVAYQKAIEIQERLVRENPSEPGFESDLALSHNNVAILYRKAGATEKAQDAYLKAIEIRENLAQQYPRVSEYRCGLAESSNNLGNLYRDAGKLDEALALYGKAIDTLEEILNEVPQHSGAIRALPIAHVGRARTLEKLNQHEQAVTDWKAATERTTEKLRPLYRFRWAYALAHAGQHAEAGRVAQGIAEEADLDGATLYDTACVFSVSLRAAADDAELDEEQREELCEEYAAQAMLFLKRAHTAGFFENSARTDHMKRDPDLDPLRARREFVGFLQQLEPSGPDEQ